MSTLSFRSGVKRAHGVTRGFDHGIESLASPTASAALQLRLRFVLLRMTSEL
jgi:hypothetical protein